jgi:DNA adenine methylase Dam
MEKQYIDSVMNYTGSKYKLLKQILPNFDYTKPYFVDLFTGGGSVYTNVVDRYEKIIVNDIIPDLIGIHSELINSDDIISDTKILCPGKENPLGFKELRESYNSNPTPAKLWALMLSSTNNMMRFNLKLKYNQTYGERGWNSNTDKKVESFINHIRLYKNKLKFICKSFDEVDISSDKVMFYCDPPYSNTEAGYNAYWKKDNDDKLYNYLKNIDKNGSSFMISGTLKHDGKNCVILDKLISDGYRCVELEFNYNKVSRKGNKETKEVIIMNY